MDTKRLASKNTPSECWLSVNGEVWDVTEFLDKHPGGRQVILDFAGLADCTSEFERHHPARTLELVLGRGKLIGRITPPVPSSSWLSLADIEQEAKQKLGERAYNYFATGAEDEVTLRANEEQFRKHAWLVPRTLLLRPSGKVDLTATLFGCTFSLPLVLCATAMQRLADPTHAERASCRAAQSRNVAYMIPHLSSVPWNELDAPFLQLYLPQDPQALDHILRQASQCASVRALFVTVDSARVGKRERDLRSGAATSPRALSSQWKTTFSVSDLKQLLRQTSLPVVLKGVQRGEDAVLAVRLGVRGIMVSNHGARNLDGARPSLASLVDVHRALVDAGLRQGVAVLLDGGVRRGADVCKALGLGADMVGVGRPMLYSLAARGQQGVEQMVDILSDEMHTAMSLMGCEHASELRGLVEFPRAYL